MNTPPIYVTGDTFSTTRRLWFLCMVGLVAVLFAYGASDGVLWADRGTLLGLGTLFLSACALVGIARQFERQGDRLVAVVRRLPKYPMIILDKKGRTTCLSDSLEALIGRSPADLSHTDTWAELFVRDEKTERFSARTRALSEAGARVAISGEVTAKGTDGRALPVCITYAPLCSDRTGGVLHVCDSNRSEQIGREMESYSRAENALLELIHELFVPESPGRRLTGATLSVSAMAREHASGDFFECVPWNSGVYDVVVGDVMGKGLAAALIGLEAKSGLLQAVTSLMTQEGNAGLPEVGQVVGEAKRFIAHKLAVRESFITLCYARFDFDERQLYWVDCGHAPIIHWQASTRRAVLLKGTNTPIGFEADETYQVCRTGFASGDVFVICSDGIIETRSPVGESFGAERLASVVAASSELPIHEIGRAIRMRLAEFSRKGIQTKDEQTVVCVRVHETKSVHCKREWGFNCPPQLSALNQFRQHVREVYADPDVVKSVSPGEADAMLLALHEVLVNIIGHSIRGSGEEASLIRLEARLFDDRMEWTFVHGMAFFSPTRIHTPSGDGSQSDGYGLFIIEQIADRVRYYRNERGESCVNLIKWFHPDLAGGATGEAGI